MSTTATLVKEIRHGHFFLDVHAGPPHLQGMVHRTTLTTVEVARLCEVDEKSVWKWCRVGKGPRHTKTRGGHFRFDRADVANWMAQNDMRVPGALRPYLDGEHLAKEELLTAVEGMTHDDRVALLAEYQRWLAVRSG